MTDRTVRARRDAIRAEYLDEEAEAAEGDVVALAKELRPLLGYQVRNILIHNGVKAHDVRSLSDRTANRTRDLPDIIVLLHVFQEVEPLR